MRGTGTSGYVTQNKFNLRGPPHQRRERDETKPSRREPNAAILEHNRKREIEVQVETLRDELEEEGLPEAEIEEKLSAYREKLLTQAEEDKERGVAAAASRDHAQETHQIAARKAAQMDKLRNAFGFAEDINEGDAFNRELQEQKRQQRIIDREVKEAEKIRAREEREKQRKKEAKRREKDAKKRRREEEEEQRRLEKERKREAKRRKESERSPERYDGAKGAVQYDSPLNSDGPIEQGEAPKVLPPNESSPIRNEASPQQPESEKEKATAVAIPEEERNGASPPPRASPEDSPRRKRRHDSSESDRSRSRSRSRSRGRYRSRSPRSGDRKRKSSRDVDRGRDRRRNRRSPSYSSYSSSSSDGSRSTRSTSSSDRSRGRSRRR